MRFIRKNLIYGLVSTTIIFSLCGSAKAGFFDSFETTNNTEVNNSVANYYKDYNTTNNITNVKYETNVYKMNSNDYEEAGKTWGKRLYNDNNPALKPEDGVDGPVSQEFICDIIGNDKRGIKFFDIHSDLKEAFRKGFREGYPDRIADLVLGPHLQRAAKIIGFQQASDFTKVVNDFEHGWAETLGKAVNTFVVLIAEGSQADREKFIKGFTRVYKKKWEANQRIIKSGKCMKMESEGGTQLFVDPTKTVSTLDIPSDKEIEHELYKQTFIVMGDEMGRRFSNNLIPRPELVDWLRRSRTALNLDQGDPVNLKTIAQNLAIIEKSFANSYGTDWKYVFQGLAREAGYKI